MGSTAWPSSLHDALLRCPARQPHRGLAPSAAGSDGSSSRYVFHGLGPASHHFTTKAQFQANTFFPLCREPQLPPAPGRTPAPTTGYTRPLLWPSKLPGYRALPLITPLEYLEFRKHLPHCLTCQGLSQWDHTQLSCYTVPVPHTCLSYTS